MTVTIILSDNSRLSVDLHTVPGYDAELATEDAIQDAEAWSGLAVVDWETNHA